MHLLGRTIQQYIVPILVHRTKHYLDGRCIDNNIDDDVNNDNNNNDNNDNDSDNDDDNGDNNNDVNVGRPIAGGAFGVVYKDDSTVHSACPFLYTASSMFMTHRIPPSTMIMM